MAAVNASWCASVIHSRVDGIEMEKCETWNEEHSVATAGRMMKRVFDQG